MKHFYYILCRREAAEWMIKMKLKIMALILVCALALSGAAAAYTPTDFASGAPSGITFDGEKLIVSDTFNKVIWSVDGENATKLAGVIGSKDPSGEPIGRYADGAIDKAQFKSPWTVVKYKDGYAVSDSDANVIRYVTAKEVKTLAGTGKAGKSNDIGGAATFNMPTGLAAGDKGELYIADTGNNLIRMLNKNGYVSTFAKDILEPTGLCWYDGALYVAETGRNRIVKIAGGELTVIAGIANETEEPGYFLGGYADGPIERAEFDHPQGVAVGDDGTVYVADTDNGAVRQIKDGRVYTLAVSRGTPEMPAQPRGMAFKDGKLYVADLLQQNVLVLDTAFAGYTDVPSGEWYEQTIMDASTRGLVNGVGDGAFDPEGDVTRAMFVTMLSRVQLGIDGNSVIFGETVFPDVADDAWYGDASRWAADAEIVQGSDGLFLGDSNITREQLVTMLYRYAKLIGTATATPETEPEFTDKDDISEWALDAVLWASESGIVGGYEDGSFLPGGNATRAESAAMLIRFMNAMAL